MEMMMVNPKKRRAKRRAPARRRTTTVRRRRRRNPIKMNVGAMVKNTLMPSVTAATGAVAVDVALGYLPLPAMMKTGPVRHATKVAAAIGMGLLASNFVKPKTAEAFASGAVTVAVYGAMKEAIGKFAPAINLGEYDFDTGDLAYLNPGLVVGAEDEDLSFYPGESDSMGAYDSNDFEL